MMEMLELAKQAAIKRFDPEIDRRTFFLGAVGIRRDGVVVSARNEAATERTPSVHAEARLVRKLGLDAPVVYVARYSRGRDGLAMAQPCPYCMSLLRIHRVKKVVFTTETGYDWIWLSD